MGSGNMKWRISEANKTGDAAGVPSASHPAPDPTRTGSLEPADERVKVRIPRASRRPQRNSMPRPRTAPSGVAQHCWRGTWGRAGADWFRPAERTLPMAPPPFETCASALGDGRQSWEGEPSVTLRSSRPGGAAVFGGGVAPRDPLPGNGDNLRPALRLVAHFIPRFLHVWLVLIRLLRHFVFLSSSQGICICILICTSPPASSPSKRPLPPLQLPPPGRGSTWTLP
jgi:hypothetical protein